MTPFFSVIITTYNRPKKLIRAVQSVLDQTYKDFELIIVNDGSQSDYTEVINYIEPYSQIRYFFKENEERSVARNYGVDKANGKFICFLDDDDYYLNNHLQVLYNEIEKQNFTEGLYHTYSKMLLQDGSWSQHKIIQKDNKLTEQEYYLTDGVMTMNCSCFSKNILIEFPYNPDLTMSEDSNQRIRALSKYPVYRIPKYTSVYDFSESSTKQHNLNNLLEYRKTWFLTFKDPLVAPFINKKIRAKTLSHHTLLILNYHRLEIPYSLFFKWLIQYFMYAPSIKRLNESIRLTYRKVAKK